MVVGDCYARDLRPPAVPLIACDPYFSVWSTADHLTDDVTRHWSGTPQSLVGLVRVDGKTYRVIGNEPRQVPALEQKKVQVLPTRTIYEFEGADIGLTLTFMTPTLPQNLDVLSRPITYIAWAVKSQDSREHAVSLYFDASAQLAVNTMDQEVVASRYRVGSGITALRVGTKEQPMLQKSGDSLRIDWGYLYVAAPPVAGLDQAIASRQTALTAFAESGSLPEADDLSTPRPVLALRFDLGKVRSAAVSRHLVVAYDDEFSLEYLYRRVRPYWRRKGATAQELIQKSLHEYDSLVGECVRFDTESMADFKQVGNEQYALLCALSYREAFAAQKLVVDYNGTPLFFSKENSSGANVGTVDVIYPTSPILMLFNPKLLTASLVPILEYASSWHWPQPFAPHDVGTYPLANGRRYSGGEMSPMIPPEELARLAVQWEMPVEETADMLILVGAIAKVDGNTELATSYWGLLTKWADYLKVKGLDPENQLCTDDFTGHLAHNANLSAKAILALGSYAMLSDLTGRKDAAAQYRKVAQEFAAKWADMANDGDHFRLAFDKPGTWSQKYNLAWDKLLGLNLFPSEVARKEIAYYKTKLNAFGLPLDSRAEYTKLDWLLWSATLAEKPADFDTLIAGAYKFADEGADRVPLSDFYNTDNGKHRGFRARSVVGGIFIKMLADEAIWKKWAGRGLASSER